MKVPLDYAHPVAADDLKLAVARKKATGPASGSAPCWSTPAAPAAPHRLPPVRGLGYPAAVTSRYDMAAVDPRGVARSEPVDA